MVRRERERGGEVVVVTVVRGEIAGEGVVVTVFFGWLLSVRWRVEILERQLWSVIMEGEVEETGEGERRGGRLAEGEREGRYVRVGGGFESLYM